MEKLTVGNFAAGLNAQIGEHGGDEIVSIEPADKGYKITTKDYNGTSVELLIDSMSANTAVNEAVDDEIAEYSMNENVGYMSLVAGRLLNNKKIHDVPLPELVTYIIQLAEEFDMEHGTDMVGGDTVAAINQFAEQRLVEKFG